MQTGNIIDIFNKTSKSSFCKKETISITHNNKKWFLEFLMGIQGRMVDALVYKGDEGRGTAAISFGEMPSNL